MLPTETFNIVYRKNKNLKELLTRALFPVSRREKYSCFTSCNSATSVKTKWSLTVHLFLLLLVRNTISEVISHVLLLMSFIWWSVLIVNVNMLGLQLLLNNVSVFISQILEPRKFVVGLLGNLILFDAIQRFHCIYASVYTRCVARPNQASRGEFFCEYS